MELQFNNSNDASVKTMTSLEIAELTGKQHKNVLRDIRVMIETFIAQNSTGSKLSPLTWHCNSVTYLDSKGEEREMYSLDKNTTITLLSGYDVVARHKIVTRWTELERQQIQSAPAPYHLPQNHIEALQAYLDQLKVTQAQQLQLEAAQPKVEQYERTMNAEGFFTIAEVAKTIGTGQNRLFDFLRTHNILFYHRGHNQPYQQYVDQGWFMVRQKTFQRGDKSESYPQLFVTPKGVEAIRKKWDAGQTGSAVVVSGPKPTPAPVSTLFAAQELPIA